MLTLTQIVALANTWGGSGGLDNDSSVDFSSMTAAAVVPVNWAIRTISKQIKQLDPKIALTLTADLDTYALRGGAFSRKVIRPYRVYINGVGLLSASREGFGIWTLSELDRIRRMWRTDSSDVPTAACHYGESLVLHPKPTAAVVAQSNHFVCGTYMAADMAYTSPSANPDLPEELHEAVAYLAVVRSTLPNVTEAEAWQRLNAFNAEWKEAAAEIRKEHERTLAAWGTTSGSHFREEIWT